MPLLFGDWWSLQGDKEMVEEGQKLWQDMLGLREKLLLEPTLLATKEGGKVVEEFHRMHESFEVMRPIPCFEQAVPTRKQKVGSG